MSLGNASLVHLSLQMDQQHHPKSHQNYVPLNLQEAHWSLQNDGTT